MYRKQQSHNDQKQEKLFQLKPQLIAIEFDKKQFEKVKDIKKWFVSKYTKLGFVVNFDDKSMRDEDDSGYYFQLSKVYKEPYCEQKIEYQQGVILLYHFTEYQIKDDKKISEIKKLISDLE